MKKHILLYGKDALILQTRAFVLRFSAFAVTSVSSLSLLADRIAASPVDLLVLCHTLSPAERQAALTLVGDVWPEAKTIVLAGRRSVPFESLAERVNIFDGPQVLVDRSRQLTGL